MKVFFSSLIAHFCQGGAGRGEGGGCADFTREKGYDRCKAGSRYLNRSGEDFGELEDIFTLKSMVVQHYCFHFG